jgi:hypothetical protein
MKITSVQYFYEGKSFSLALEVVESGGKYRNKVNPRINVTGKLATNIGYVIMQMSQKNICNI